MLTASIKVKLVLFAIVGLVATSFLGARYVGIDPLSSSYRVTVAMPDAGGIFTNGEVTYRGVPVGRIGDLRVTTEGMEAELKIEGDAPDIPADATITVANRSAIGEQYIDLRSESTDGPMLADGDRITGTDASAPPAIDEVLRTARDFTRSVPSDSLNTVIDETYLATRGAGENLGRLLDTSADFIRIADKNFLVTSGLIENSATVLQTQEESGASIRGFSTDLDTIAKTLQTSDGDLRQLLDVAPAAAREIDALFRQVGTPLGTLMGNLVTPAEIFGTNSAGVEDALIRVPEALSVGFSINTSKGLNLGQTQRYFDPTPCTSGYGGTTVRPGTDTSDGRPFNLNAGCTAPPSSGTNVRGPGAVPRKAGALAKVTTVDSLSDLLGGN